MQTQAEENDAKTILKAMSAYVGSQKTSSLVFDSAIEIITPQLEKIQFTNSGGFMLTCSRGYGNSVVGAILEAGAEFGLRPAGEDCFSAWIRDL